MKHTVKSGCNPQSQNINLKGADNTVTTVIQQKVHPKKDKKSIQHLHAHITYI